MPWLQVMVSLVVHGHQREDGGGCSARLWVLGWRTRGDCGGVRHQERRRPVGCLGADVAGQERELERGVRLCVGEGEMIGLGI